MAIENNHTMTSACRIRYSAKYDRYLCATCKVWTEDACGCGPDDGCPSSGSPFAPDDEIIAKADPTKYVGERWRRATT